MPRAATLISPQNGERIPPNRIRNTDDENGERIPPNCGAGRERSLLLINLCIEY